MVCIYCSGPTRITNSRPQKRLNQTWRRHSCTVCHAIFTTHEAADLSTSLVVRNSPSKTNPFSRDTLFLSVYRAVGHRQSSTEDARALTATIATKLLNQAESAVIEATDIINTTLQVLQRFDKAAAVQYAAYHRARSAGVSTS